MELPIIRSLHTLSRVLSAYSEHSWEKDGYNEIRIGHLQPLLELSKGDFSNNQLAEKTGMTKQSMNRLIKELLSLGYVKLYKNEQDARVINLKLSPKAHSFLKYLESKNQELDRLLIPAMGEDMYRVFKSSLNTLSTYLEGKNLDEGF